MINVHKADKTYRGVRNLELDRDTVAVAEVREAIRTLKDARKNQKAKFVVIREENGDLILRATTEKQLLLHTSPTPRQLKSLNIKFKRINVSRNEISRFFVEESKETTKAISENIKDSGERHKFFYSQLALNISD